MTQLVRPRKSLGWLVRTVALACCAGPAGLLAAHAPLAVAQSTPTQRVVLGKVVDKSDDAIKGATVYLKDGHTLAVKSYIASDDGSFRFGQLVANTDYQVWAEVNGKKSAVKNISSFDSRSEFNLTLKIDK